MTVRVVLRKGSNAVHSNYVGHVGEITYDTDGNTIRIHNGSTPGGIRTALLNSNGTIVSTNLVATSTTTTSNLNSTNISTVNVNSNAIVTNILTSSNLSVNNITSNTISTRTISSNTVNAISIITTSINSTSINVTNANTNNIVSISISTNNLIVTSNVSTNNLIVTSSITSNSISANSISVVSFTGQSINQAQIGLTNPNTAAFTSVTVVTEPTSNTQLANKSYVDRKVRLAIALSGI